MNPQNPSPSKVQTTPPTVPATTVPATTGATPQRVWQSRTGNPPAADFLTYSESTQTDRHYFDADIAGSIVHVAGLHHAGLVDQDEAVTLIAELQAVHGAYHTGNLVLDPALEDVHMNIEAKVLQVLGPVGAKLHTGRSRNDQVATCLVLYARQGLAQLAEAANRTANALQEQAEHHLETPWVARTHGQPAQPATLGFLLAAHAYRFQAVADAALQVSEQIGESPLGGGAIAGSTLPLDPKLTAKLLGLRPLRNSLLATGTRDSVVQTTALAAQAGNVATALAEDLLQMTRDGTFASPTAYSTGSSLMPQKRNPDALELVRGKGKALLGTHLQALQVTTGLGLGYQRDLQETKPSLVSALTESIATLETLGSVVAGGRFDVDRLTASLEAPGITATDVAEALVAHGVPFRTAYHAVARATQAHLDQGQAFADALAAEGLPGEAVDAAIAATTPDPARRNTLGGPAPEQVAQQLESLARAEERLANQIAQAKRQAAHPFGWIHTAPEQVLDATTEEDA